MNHFQEQIERTTSYIARINWSCILIMIALLLLTSILQKHFGIAPLPATATKLYIGAIILGVLSIPISNRLFTKATSKIESSAPLETNLRIYRVAFLTKLIIVLAAFTANLILFFFSNNPQLLIIGSIYIVYQMIAVQSKDSILELLGVSSNEKPE